MSPEDVHNINGAYDTAVHGASAFSAEGRVRAQSAVADREGRQP
jgi:hypothetical protein